MFKMKSEEKSIQAISAQAHSEAADNRLLARISEHITNIYQQGELMQSATVRKFRTDRKVQPNRFERNWNLLRVVNNCKYKH